MPQPRKLDPTTLLSWNAQGMTTVEMQKRLAAQWTTASVDLIRLRLREARGVLDGWGDSFAGSERYERFAVAVGELEGIAETLGDIDVSWG